MTSLSSDPTGAVRAGRVRTVCVQGLGFVGAANAVAIALAADHDGRPLYRVVGLDQPTEAGRERAQALVAGRFPFPTTDAALVEAARAAHASGNLSAVTDDAILADADVIVVDVGLDLEEKGERPTFALAPFQAALTSVGDRMRPDTLVLLESTVPPGTCERIVAPLLRSRLARRGVPSDDLLLAYCYERVMPGEHYLDSIIKMWRVYAGLTPASADAAEAFLTTFLSPERPPRRLASIRAAEMAKVLENTFRAVNIALIDEWEKFADRIDVDLFEVLEAIRVRPTHRNIRYPGLGVGGYCLSKDPLFGAAAAREIFEIDDLAFPLSASSVRINDAMPLASVERLAALLPLNGSRILVLGASYRQDVGDTRFSPSATLINALIDRGARVEVADPVVDAFPEANVVLHRTLPASSDFDAVVLAVAHRAFSDLDIAAWAGSRRPVVLDTNGVLTRTVLDDLAGRGFRVAGIGRGDV
ncbi:MAG: nucleotide sugar dehydrogenase [Acetobacteraceae bacterium]